jgi:hypothetical protein
MVKSLRTFFLSFTIVALLLISAIGTTTVYADDDDTGNETKKTETTKKSSQDEQPPQEEQSDESQPTSEEAGADEQDLGEIMGQVPDNTTVTVLNSEGEAMPLASQETAEVIESAYDPIWCPEGTPPVPGAAGCTESFSSFTELLTYLQTNETDVTYQQAGTIYIQNNQYLGGETEINFNNYNFNQINNYDLTLQGGWNTVDNTVNSVDTTQFSVPITIGSGTNPWIGSLTMNNISISDVLDQTGLVLYSQNDITLSNVEITNSQTGADLNAGGDVTINNSKINKNKQANAVVNAGGNVNIANSTFNDSGGMGIAINSGGSVSLASLESNNNQLFGADIQAIGSVAISNSFFSGNKSANIVSCPGNGGDDDDDDDHKKGDKDDDDKDDEHNKRDDKYSLKSGDDDKPSSKGDDDDDKHSSKDDDDDDKKPSKDHDDDDDDGGQTSCNNPTSFSGYGLQVVTSGSISLDTVTASDNNLFGAHLEGTDIAISNSVFSNNGTGAGNEPLGKGLEINATAGDTGTGSVSLFNVEANNNQLFGANIQATGSVAIGGMSFFSGNNSANIVSCNPNGSGGDDDDDDKKKGDKDDDDKDGHHDKRDDKYSLKSGDDDKQSSKGDDDDDKHSSKDDDDDDKKPSKDHDDDDDNDGGQTSCNNPTTTTGYGLQVVTQGIVSLDGVTASDNGTFGAHLEGASVAISNSMFNNNGSGIGNDPVGKGLEVISGSDVSISNVEANNNQLFGANIQAIGSVSISNSFFSGNKSTNVVSCQGNGNGGDDDDDDDDKKKGDKKDDDKDGDHDKRDDKYSLMSGDNDKQSSKGDDDDDKHSSKDDDDDDDDKKPSKDDDDDDDDGQTSCNNTGSSFSGYGLQVVTSGPISFDNVTASDNNLFGAHIEGTDIAISNSVFSNNGTGAGNEPMGKGLEINSTGVVSLFNVEANNNQLFGANIQAIGDVIIGNSFFSGNNSANIVSCNPNGSGSDDDDDKKKGDKDDDDKDGDHDKRDDKYSLKSDDDDKQSSKGDDDDDKHSSKDDDDDDDKKPSKDDDDDDDDDGQTPCNNATTTNGYGLQVVTRGIVSLDGVTASDNGVNGAILNSPSNITVTNSTFDNNGGTGLIITTTSGQVTLENVTATNNGLDGVDVTGDSCITTVQVIDGTYSNNTEYGLKINNATLNQSGSPVFMNNGVGNIFQNPGTCLISIPLLNLPTASGQGINGKVFSPQTTGYPTHYRMSKYMLSLTGSSHTYKGSYLFASKTNPYKYTGGLAHR